MNIESTELVIIGGGIGGLSSAISAYDNGIKNIVLIEREPELGGILNQCIHNGFGVHTFNQDLTGPEFAHRVIQEFKNRKIRHYLSCSVLSINNNKEVIASSSYGGLIKFNAKSIIYSCGCNERTFGQIYTPGSRPNGVYTAGLAQKYLNIDGYLVGKRVYILGSGDIGLIMARRMTLEGAKVIGVSEIMPYSNGLKRNIVQCLNDYNIPLRLSNTVSRIIGKNQVEAIEICDVDENRELIENTKRIIECDVLLLSVGLYPFNSLLKTAGAKVNKNTKGAYVDQNLETSITGIFSCGNSLHVHDLVDYVYEEGKNAGYSAANYIKNKRGKLLNTIEVSFKGNISYLLPNIINIYETSEIVKFSFRTKSPCMKAKINIYINQLLYKTLNRFNVFPSEMQFINLNLDLLREAKHIMIELIGE